MTVTKVFTIDMGHRLSNYDGKCKRFHGHTYKIEVSIEGNQDDRGIIVDFNYLKAAFDKLVDSKFDHKMLLKEGDPINEAVRKALPQEDESIVWVTYNPTVENIARNIFEILDSHMRNFDPEVLKLHVKHLRIYETPTSYADIYA